MKQLSENELAKIREVFRKYDVNDNDTLNWDEFCMMIDDLDSHVTMNEKAAAFDDIDSNNTGMISFEEFTAWWRQRD